MPTLIANMRGLHRIGSPSDRFRVSFKPRPTMAVMKRQPSEPVSCLLVLPGPQDLAFIGWSRNASLKSAPCRRVVHHSLILSNETVETRFARCSRQDWRCSSAHLLAHLARIVPAGSRMQH
jgi:hypothetical protein